MSDFIVASICLSDIPADRITKSPKNGKKYLSIVIQPNRDGEDRYGNTHNVSVSQTKEERETKVNKVFIGNGKGYVFGSGASGVSLSSSSPGTSANMPVEDDDLPF